MLASFCIYLGSVDLEVSCYIACSAIKKSISALSLLLAGELERGVLYYMATGILTLGLVAGGFFPSM